MTLLPDAIAAAGRTVAHLGAYLAELKTAALPLALESIGERGYFKPAEEERARQLQISYWQTRSALLELVYGLRSEHTPDSPHYREAFVAAFAGAILLVDSARFLRENFHERPAVRRKLNEHDEPFGIPPLMYETVQKSLTSPRHAWYLLQAMRYYQRHEAELRVLGGAADLAGALEIIDRLAHRLQVPMSDYARARLRVRAGRAARRVGDDLIGQAMYALQRMASLMVSDRFLQPRHRPALPSAIEQAVVEQLLPGDVLVVRKEYALTNYFLPGYWPHAALYLGEAGRLVELGLRDHPQVRARWPQLGAGDEGSVPRVLEALKDGVRIRGLPSPLASDSVVVLRPLLPTEAIARGIARAMVHEGKPYDFDFDFTRSDRLVCTEVVYRAYDGLGEMSFSLTRRAGRNTLAASDLIRMALAGRGFQAVAAYAPGCGPSLLRGEAACNLMKARCPE